MSKILPFGLIMTSVVLLLINPAALQGRSATTVKRLGLFVSTNKGGEGRVELRYANRDARAFAEVMHHLGGLERRYMTVVTGATRARINQAIATLKARIKAIKAAGYRAEVIFYYSGHSDERGLLLGGETYLYETLKRKITGLHSDVKVLILDSCASGSLTRIKGGKRRPAFLSDASTQTRGHAIITSSSSDEVAQESDRIRGSYFTHYLLSGLRGAADHNSDRRVTLNEAYQYAYHETLSQTSRSLSGPQHPVYDFRLAGTGELVLTDLRSSAGTLVFPKNEAGRYFIEDQNGHLIAEIKKLAGKPMRIGLEPGRFTITHTLASSYRVAEIELEKGETLKVTAVSFREVEGEPTVARGGAVTYKPKDFSFQIIPDIEAIKHHRHDEVHKFAFGLIGAHSGKIDGVGLSTLGHVVEEGGVDGVMIAGGININHGSLDGVQIAGGGNYAGQSITGIQIAGGANFAGANISGVQIANVNIGFKAVEGLQLGVANYAATLNDGAQVGTVNILRQGRGTQIGIVNYAQDITGFQLGVVTVAQRNSGYSLGLINYAGNGTLDVALSYDALHFTNFTLRSGSRHLYTVYQVGTRPSTREDIKTIVGLGIGTKWQWGNARFAFDLVTHSSTQTKDRDDPEAVNAEDDDGNSRPFKNAWDDHHHFTRGQLKLAYRYRKIFPFIGFTVGHYRKNLKTFEANIASAFNGTVLSTGDSHTTWLGFMLGVSYSFKAYGP